MPVEIFKNKENMKHKNQDIIKREGTVGLYKGMGPALIKAAVASSLNFWLYEHICYILALRFTNTWYFVNNNLFPFLLMQVSIK